MIALEDSFDEKFTGVLMHGIPAILGIDGSSWFGFPDMTSAVPITAFDNFKNNFIGGWLDDSIDEEERWTRLMPAYIKHWMRLHRMNETGAISTDRYGAPTVTPQDVRRMSAEIKDWAWEQYKQVPTPDQMGNLEKTMYSLIGAPSLTQSLLPQGAGDQESERGPKKEKGEMNRVVAQMFVKNINSEEWADYIDGADNAGFTENFWTIVHSWPEEEQQKLRDTIKEYADRGMSFDTASILNSIWER
ncbi:MAG: hypothetical protein MZV49_24385, partial [Rhodopseudomonas palustris]|nr:hypothetical protein [Rhodopseudomonas palustris]